MTIAGFLISMVAIAAAFGVVGSKNALYSALSLVTNLLAVAGLYALLGAHFLAVSQVIVYAGAIMVLVLFVLMLLNLKTDPAGTAPGWGRLAVIVISVSVVVASVMPSILGAFQGVPAYELADRAQRAEGSVRNVGKVLYGEYVAQFELASLVLLVGVVGAVMLAKRKKTTPLAPRDLSELAGPKAAGTGAN